MKEYLINMHLLVPKSRSSAKVKVKYKGYISQKMAVSEAFVFHKHILFYFLFLKHITIIVCNSKILVFSKGLNLFWTKMSKIKVWHLYLIE